MFLFHSISMCFVFSDASLLKELSQDNVDTDKLDELVSKHMDLLKHVMKCKCDFQISTQPVTIYNS